MKNRYFQSQAYQWSALQHCIDCSILLGSRRKKGLRGKDLPSLPSSWGCCSVNLHTPGLKGPSANDLLTVTLVWTHLLKALSAVWAVSLSAVLLGINIFIVKAGSKPSGALRQICWVSPKSRKLEIYSIQRCVFLQLAVCRSENNSGDKEFVFSLYSRCPGNVLAE